MSLETDLFNALKPLVGNRVSRSQFPQPDQNPVWPAILFDRVTTVPVTDLCGDGDDSTATPLVQLDLVAETWPVVDALRLSVVAVMEAFSPPAKLENYFYDEDSDTKTKRWILEYTFHGSSE